MPWVVDTCLVIDVLDADPEYGAISADLLDGTSTEGLLLCPVSFIELAPAFGGELKRQEHFLRQINVDYTQDWTWVDTCAAFAGWHRYITLKMKRSQLIKHLKGNGAVLLREGRRHTIYKKGSLKTEVPRHEAQ